MTRTLTLRVHGTPVPQGSKKAYRNKHTGRVNLVESAGAKHKAWRQQVAWEWAAAHHQPPATGPITLHLTFWLPRPKSHYRTGRNAHLLRAAAPTAHTTKPDLDKLTRAVKDALTEGGAYHDDSQVNIGHQSKHYADHDIPPGVLIALTPQEDHA